MCCAATSRSIVRLDDVRNEDFFGFLLACQGIPWADFSAKGAVRHGIHSFGKPQENSELRPKDVEHGPQLVDADVYRCTGSLSGCVDHAKCPAVLVESSCLPKLAISVRDASFHPEQVASSLLKAQKNHQC